MPSDAQTVDYRTLLEEERAQLRSQLSELGFGDDDGPTYDPNFADLSQVTAERGEAEALGGQLQETLGDVAHALSKLDDGSFGTCEDCGEPIDPARLEAMPATRYCISHAARH